MMTESQRAEVVRVARSFIGTPYHHMGRVKGAGVDCATLLAEVYYEAGVLKEPVRIEYLGAAKGRLKSVQKGLSAIANEDRPAAGKRFNEVKAQIEAAFESARNPLSAPLPPPPSPGRAS